MDPSSKDVPAPTPSAGGSSPKAKSSKLNPDAKEWNPLIERTPEEDRTLFLTFSKGYPLSEDQIIRFFNDKYGPCVERVYVHWPVPRTVNAPPPLFGKVVFKMSSIPIWILNGHEQTKFKVDGKPLWCKKFEAKHKEVVPDGSNN
ncbi:uncharacterized protein LOC123223303 [Mangifera indica]|uniref:uncharacterized protein LOC123223303 n=1 Tax=Mangifera indica TaxID=29780 RepID=UPI001CFC430B|nr:uncharacterized protein LOC123223303 [Mangifera indica]